MDCKFQLQQKSKGGQYLWAFQRNRRYNKMAYTGDLDRKEGTGVAGKGEMNA